MRLAQSVFASAVFGALLAAAWTWLPPSFPWLIGALIGGLVVTKSDKD